MSALSFRELYDGAGNPYKNRDSILIERIANKQMLKLNKDKGYIKVFDVKVTFQDGTTTEYKWKEMSDEEIIQELVKLRGVGRWTAEMILIFTMLRPDVFPIGDIGMIRGIEKSYNSGEKMSREELYAISEKWKPWRTVACCFMWRTVDPEPVEY